MPSHSAAFKRPLVANHRVAWHRTQRLPFRSLALRAAGLTGGAAMLALLAYGFVLRPWDLRWGATDAEVRMALPGDELILHPWNQSTRAITIHATAAQIWPWLVQMGQGRGGLYSYDQLENIAGCDIHSAGRIVPEWQDTKVGDLIRMGPQGYPVFAVSAIEPNRALVLSGVDTQSERPPTAAVPSAEQPTLGSWTFYLSEQGDGTTRLIIRSRGDHVPGIGNDALWGAVEAVQFIMERGQLLGIRDRVEAAGR